MPGQSVDAAYVKPRITEFLNIGDYSINRESCVPIEEPLFEPIPSVIRFTDYEPLQIKSVVFKLRNKDSVARTVRIIQPESRLFQVSLFSSEKSVMGEEVAAVSGSKVAPGLEVKYLIKFSPEAKSDYNYDLHIVTEREKFIVPIVAVGKRAMIDFPDTINFGKECPVKYVTEKPVIIRNLGDKTTKWELQLESGFSADKKEGVLEFGRSEQIILKFYPVEKRLYESEAVLRYDGMEAYIPMTGNAINGNVYLSKKLVKLGESYLRLKNQRTIEIVNKSDVKIDFEWRTFKTEAEELEKKQAIKDHLDQEEQLQRLMMRDAAAMEDNHELLDIQDDDDSGYEEVDERTLMLTNQKKAELMLQRRYKSIKKSIEENLFLFEHDIFDIKPVTGTIWPKSEMTITITFKPSQALEYFTHAYCNISCSDERLPLTLEGTGLGPKAYLSVTSYNIKEVCVNERKEVPFYIENKGDIPAEFRLLKNSTPFSKMIDFDVKEGVLEVGQKINFNMTFQSSKVGEFQEVFRWAITDSRDELTLHVRGHVRAPEFEFKENRIDFGVVSYQFEKVQEIELENKSQVKFKFNLRIPGDNKNNEKEFEISPDSDEIKPGETKKIQIKFLPHKKGNYNMVMVLDIEGVGKDMKSIPIEAFCDVPKVSLLKQFLDFGSIFLRDPKEQTVTLVNSSPLPARFKIMPQSPETQMIGKLHTEPEEGIIPALGNTEVKVTLTTLSILELVQLELGIKIIANEDKLLVVKINAKSEGPKVDVLESVLDFKEVQVLEESSMFVHIKNNSSINAGFYAFTKKKDSVFKPIQRHYNLDVNQQMEIEIVCNADDEGIFTDVLHIVIKEGIDKEVKLRAKATGKTIFCNNDLDKGIDFGTQYTFKHQTKEIFIENKGRRDQKLEWVRKKPDKKKEEEDKNKQAAKKVKEEEEPTPTFSIFPESRLLPKKTGSMFQFRAVSTKKGKISETFILQSVIDGDRKAKKLYEVVVTGEFINPKLTFDMTNIEFVYDWVKGVPPKIISQNIGITCDSVLPTKFKLLIEKPFSIYPDNFDLSAYKKVTTRLDFDPNYNTSKRSCVEPRQLKVRHSKHPFVEAIDVVGIFNFPNLELETNEINFGSVLNDTSKKIVMKMKNVSKMNVEYVWSFLEDEAREMKDNIPINEIFDILPLNGTLEPNQVEQVEFVYYGLPGRRFEAKAICQIEGGPDEKVTLIGESSKIEYLLIFPNSTTKNEIEFKEIPFSQWNIKEFFIQNLGKVPFDFKVKTDNITRKGLLHITPSTGKIAGGGKSRVKIHFCPGLPGDYLEKFKIQVAHFEAETIYLRGYGQYPALKFELNREVSDDLRKKIEDEGQLVDNISIDSQTSSITKKFPDGEFISRLDRKILADAVMKNIEDRAKGITSTNGSMVADTKEDHTVPAIPADMKDDDTAGGNAANTLANTTAKSGFMKNTAANKFEKSLYENIVVGRYVIDLGNVIAGNTAQYQFRVYNVGKMPQSTITFDMKNMRTLGFKLSTDRIILKNKDKNFEDIRLTFTTNSKKPGSTGRMTFELPVEIDNGPKYVIDVRVNVTVPELGFSDQEVNFGKVICGQKKTITLRISNDREVECEWNITQRKDAKKKLNEPRNENKFTIVPSSGVLGCFGKQNIEVTFVPTFDKLYNTIFEVAMKDNQKKLELLCKGQGIIPTLQFIPEEMVFNPCLPYENNVYKCLEVKNASEFDIEFFSLDFDKQYLEEEQVMAVYEPLHRHEGVCLTVRKPGDQLWTEMLNYHAVFTDNQKINAAIAQIREAKDLPEDEKVVKIAELEKDRKTVKEEVKYPMAIDEAERRYVVVYGPKQCGKSQLAKTLSEKHQRGLVNFNQILQWNNENFTPAAARAKEYLAKRTEEKELMLAEKEKQKKKNPKKKGQEEENLYLERYDWLSDDVLADLVIERLKCKDCNAGAVFDNLYGSFFENELVAMKAILAACQNSTTQLLHIKPTSERHGLPTCNIIDANDLVEAEKEQELASQPKDDKKKNKPIVDRRVIQANKKAKEQVAKEKKFAKDKGNKEQPETPHMVEDRPDVSQLDPSQKMFEIDEVYDMTKEEREAYFKQAQEAIDYFQGRLNDEHIHKLDTYLKKLEEEEEAKNPKNKGKDNAKKQSNKPSRPDTASRLSEAASRPAESIGKREISEIDLYHNYKQLNLAALKVVPIVEFPDPVSLPIPDPQVCQIVKKREPRKTKPKIEGFQIFTPAEYIKEDVLEKMIENEFREEREQVKNKAIELEASIDREREVIRQERTAMLLRELEDKRLIAEEQGPEALEKVETEIPPIKEEDLDSVLIRELRAEKTKLTEEFELKVQRRKRDLYSQNSLPFTAETLKTMSRWIVPKGKSIVLVLKFFSKKTGEYQTVLDFENIYSNGKPTQYKVKAVCDFPRICTNPEKIFANRRQSKQQNLAEALQKVYFKDENKFDFGPLLIGKKTKDKNDKKILAVNSATYDIINEGCFNAKVTFDLGSNISEEGSHKRGIFTIHPSHMELKPGETEKIRVWCIPDEVRVYTDDLVCMMENNPAPYVVRMEATGASPVLATLQKVIEFDRLLLNQGFTKELVLKNVGLIPAKWKILGLDTLPPEFKIEPISGELKPARETNIQIKFMATKQQKFEQEIRIVATDVEEIGINQEPLVN